MNRIFIEIKQNIFKNQAVFIGGIVVFILGLLLGFFLPSVETVDNLFYGFSSDYFNKIMCIDASPFSVLLTRIFNSLLLILLVCILCFNKYSFYFNFVIIIYRGFIIGYTFIVFVLNLGFSGVITYLFLVLVQNVFVTFAVILLITNVYDKLICKNDKYINILINYSIISYGICLVGALFEFILIVCLFRPLNLYF